MDRITFSFGRNWDRFERGVDKLAINDATEDLRAWLDPVAVQGKRVLDLGSGSGIHSLGFCRLGAAEIVSFDFDSAAVATTARMKERAGSPGNWQVRQGSVLDPRFLNSLGTFDIVYSWGVLHHTGAMWQAIQNAAGRVNAGGLLWIALYVSGPHYERDLKLKRRFNSLPRVGQAAVIGYEVARQMYGRLRIGKSPMTWNKNVPRGMNLYRDLWDWFGGLPYEVAGREELSQFLQPLGLAERKYRPAGEGSCADYLFARGEESW